MHPVSGTGCINKILDVAYMTDNPYVQHAQEMRTQLEDPMVNRQEHGVYAPRLLRMLPSGHLRDGGVRKVLDFGCGAGNFTAQLSARYRGAEVVGADAAPDIFDTVQFGADVNFICWDGYSPLDASQFDLIVSKMTLHYLNPQELDVVAHNLIASLAPQGELAISIPFYGFGPDDMPRPFAIPVTAEVGKTGMSAHMYDYALLTAAMGAYLPENYGYAIDYVKDAEGNHKRADMLFYPKEKFRTVRRRLMKAGISDGKYDWEMMEMFADATRTVGKYVVDKALAEDMP